MKVIAHRALTRGPNKALENTPVQIDRALAEGYDVEVDLWVIDGQWYLGHDGAQHLVPPSFFETRASRMFVHAKNRDALLELTRRKLGGDRSVPWRYFSHDVDDYVLTSDGRAWVYPGKPLFEGAICVMPERAERQEEFWNCWGVCTDFAELYGTYSEMRERQRRSLEWSTENLLDGEEPVLCIDPGIEKGIIDDRRCLAVYTMYGNSFRPSEHWNLLETELSKTFSHQCPYSPSPNSSSRGLLHFTFLQVLGFPEWAQEINRQPFRDRRSEYLEIISGELSPLLPFTITFRGVMAFRAGLMLLGYPSIDLSNARKRIDEKLAERNFLRRNYPNNIVHSTLLRLSKPEDPLKLLRFADRFADTFVGTLEVEKFHLGISSWRMLPEELENLETIEPNLNTND